MSRKKKLILGITTVFAVFYAGITIGAYLERSGSTPTQEVSAEKTETPEITVQGLLEATNAERAKVGVKPLILDERLNASAQMKLDDMIKHEYFAHENHDGTWGNDYIIHKRSDCRPAENLNRANLSLGGAQKAIDALMTSEAHAAAIVNPKFDYIGFANNGNMLVQHFCDID